MKNINPYPERIQVEEQDLNLKQLFEQYAYYWKWFVFSLLGCCLLAFTYLRYTQKVYNINAKILLQDEKQASGDMAGLAELANITGMGTSSAAFVNDQIEVLRSRRLMQKVVDSNRLYLSYYLKGNIKSAEILESQSPLKVQLLEPRIASFDSLGYTFAVSKQGGRIKIKDEVKGTRDHTLGERIQSPIGDITLALNEEHRHWEGELIINYTPSRVIVDILRESVQITPNKEAQSFLVNFSMNYPLIPKAELIINSLIDQYNQDATYDKAQVTRATSAFIDSRLELISKDLAEADSKVADFKDRNQMTDMQTETRLYMQNVNENERQLVEYQTQLSLADAMRETAANDDYTLLPSNIGLNDASIQSNIQRYNELVLELDDLLQSATPDNPAVQKLKNNILQ